MNSILRLTGSANALAACLLSVGVHAQDATASMRQPTSSPTLDEIVITARRNAEDVQNVPVSVQVVGADTIQKLALTTTNDIARVAPGLTLDSPNGVGLQPSIVLRGVRWTVASGTAAVPIYLNEAPLTPRNMLVSMYDIAQVEVLRGPQGTTRGAPSISGAVTLSTKKPDTEQYGGYGYALVGNHSRRTFQGGVNIPIARDVFAVRVAGTYEESEGSRVRSINNSLDPRARVASGRISFRFTPDDNFSLDAMYQHLDLKNRYYTQLAGTGSPGATVNASFPGVPPRVLSPNYNGPALDASDYLTVSPNPNNARLKTDTIVVNANWKVLGGELNYIFSLEDWSSEDTNEANNTNQLPGFSYTNRSVSKQNHPNYTHELRLTTHPADWLDLTVGGFYLSIDNITRVDNFSSFLPGALGAPLVSPSNPNVNQAVATAYSLPIHLEVPTTQENYSGYANATVRLPYDFELSAGIRAVHDNRPSETIGTTPAGIATLPRALGRCGTAPNSAVYGANFCDTVVAAAERVRAEYSETFTPILYNISLSHRFSRSVLAYATIGNSYRSGVASVGFQSNDPNLLYANGEKAKSYELGVKTSFLDNRVRFNADVFQIDYKGQITSFPGINYYSVIGQRQLVTSNFFSNVDARVRGLEVELATRPVQNLTLNAQASYSKIKSRGGPVPCNDASRPLGPTNVINFCPGEKGEVLNTSAPFQATLRASYDIPFDSFDGYVRVLANHQGTNPNYQFVRKARQYTLVDVFAGVTGDKGAWDFGFYGRNIFNVKRELNRTPISPITSDFGSAGYETVVATVPRELGVQLRYAFGSR